MEIRTFQARSLQEALTLVRNTMGDGASILHTREVQQRKRFGLGSERMVEVEASRDVSVGSSKPARPSDAGPSNTPNATRPAVHRGLNRLDEAMLASEAARRVAVYLGETLRLSSEVVAMLVNACFDPLRLAASDASLQDLLGCVKDEVAASLLTSATLEPSFERQTIVAVVGPTGTGKSLALGKLASRFAEGNRIGMLAMDDVRPGAVDQLLQYADTASARLEVLSSADNVQEAMERLVDCNLVLVDTPGRAWTKPESIAAVRHCLEQIQPDETHLVLGASNSRGTCEKTLHAYRDCALTHMLISKLDEAADLGQWLPALQECSLPLGYMSTGQAVSQPILNANASEIARIMLGLR